jgi:hypothetical protein
MKADAPALEAFLTENEKHFAEQLTLDLGKVVEFKAPQVTLSMNQS